LAKLIRETHVDVVHTFSAVSELYAAMAVLLAGRGKVLASRRNMGYWHTWRSRWTARAVAAFGRGLGVRYAANCTAARESAVKGEWIPRRRISVIPNAAPARRWQKGLMHVPSRSSLGLCDGQQAVAVLATIRPVKDYATFLRAARLVADRCPTARFLSIGDHEPRYFAEVQSLADDLGLNDHIRWLGAVENPLSILTRCDVGVLSSESEGMSNALLEYAVAGIAAVATNVGGAAEAVEDGVTGFLVPPRSPEPMADAICRLLRDDELRRSFGASGAARARTLFSEERILDQFSQLYQSLAASS